MQYIQTSMSLVDVGDVDGCGGLGVGASILRAQYGAKTPVDMVNFNLPSGNFE